MEKSHPNLEISMSQINTSTNWQFIGVKGVESLFWLSLFSLDWWNYFKYFTGVINLYQVYIWVEWFRYVDSNATHKISSLLNFDKWLHLPFWVFFDFILFSALEIFDYYETNYWIWFIWVFPLSQAGWSYWYDNITKKFV